MTFGEVIKAGAAILDGIPMGAIIKAAVAVGITVFTAWVLIKRTKKMHEEANKKSNETYSPVDEILSGHNYVGNVDDFDDMDPEARDICRKLNKNWRKRKKKKGLKIHRRKVNRDSLKTVSLFDDEEEESEEKEKSRSYSSTSADLLCHDKKFRKATSCNNSEEIKRRKRDLGKKLREEWKEFGMETKSSFDDAMQSIMEKLGLNEDDDDDTELLKDIDENGSVLFN